MKENLLRIVVPDVAAYERFLMREVLSHKAVATEFTFRLEPGQIHDGSSGVARSCASVTNRSISSRRRRPIQSPRVSLCRASASTRRAIRRYTRSGNNKTSSRVLST